MEFRRKCVDLPFSIYGKKQCIPLQLPTRGRNYLRSNTINARNSVAAAGGVTPQIAYCSVADWRRSVIFSTHLGPVIQQVVLNFGPDASRGAPVARASVRHSFNIRNGKNENCEKRAWIDRIPGRLLGNGRSQRHAVKTIEKRWPRVVCRLHQHTSHVQSEDAGSVKMAVFEHFSGLMLVLEDYLTRRA